MVPSTGGARCQDGIVRSARIRPPIKSACRTIQSQHFGNRRETMRGPETTAGVVLVHGAWADGSSWGHVIKPLQSRGLKVLAAPIPLTSLSDDVAALERALARADNGKVRSLVIAAHLHL